MSPIALSVGPMHSWSHHPHPRRSYWLLCHACSGTGAGTTLLPPLGAVMHDPTDQRVLKPDVPSSLLRLEPLVPENLFALGEELAIERRTRQQIARFHIKLSPASWLCQVHTT